MNDIRLVVFDLDGTLIDSSADLANAVNALLSDLRVGPLPDPQIVSMVGEGAAVLVRRALAASGLDPQTPGALDRFLAHYNAHLLDYTRPYQGTTETLQDLSARMPLAVLTNKPAGATRTYSRRTWPSSVLPRGDRRRQRRWGESRRRRDCSIWRRWSSWIRHPCCWSATRPSTWQPRGTAALASASRATALDFASRQPISSATNGSSMQPRDLIGVIGRSGSGSGPGSRSS